MVKRNKSYKNLNEFFFCLRYIEISLPTWTTRCYIWPILHAGFLDVFRGNIYPFTKKKTCQFWVCPRMKEVYKLPCELLCHLDRVTPRSNYAWSVSSSQEWCMETSVMVHRWFFLWKQVTAVLHPHPRMGQKDSDKWKYLEQDTHSFCLEV